MEVALLPANHWPNGQARTCEEFCKEKFAALR